MGKSNELLEENFISETKSVGGWRIWLGLLAVAIGFGALVFSAKWIAKLTINEIESQPFLQITNREFSLFLWQHPEFMRSNQKKMSGYLSGFHPFPKVTPKPELADHFVQAPPDILFLYHAWDRLLSSEEWNRKIMSSELLDFLDYDREWLPEYWLEAPEGYRELVFKLPALEKVDVANKLPREVKRAFIGWKNYFYEGSRINAVVYRSEDIQNFIRSHHNYSPNYWKGIYPNYLKSLSESSNREIPSNEIPSFFKSWTIQ